MCALDGQTPLVDRKFDGFLSRSSGSGCATYGSGHFGVLKICSDESEILGLRIQVGADSESAIRLRPKCTARALQRVCGCSGLALLALRLSAASRLGEKFL
jgi:hypothetical protein